MTDYAWTIVPIIDDLYFGNDHGYYVISGNFVL